MTITWSEIEAEANASGFRERLVEVYRKYEGQPTDERDASNRVIKVTAASFAEHLGIAVRTFQKWVSSADQAFTSEDRARLEERKAREAEGRIRQASPERRAEIARELVQDPQIADAVIADQGAQDAVLKAYNRSPQVKQFHQDQDRYAKEQEARESENPPGISAPRVMAAMWAIDGFWQDVTENRVRTRQGSEIARLSAQWLREIATRVEAWADGVTEPMSDADFEAGIQEIVRSQS